MGGDGVMFGWAAGGAWAGGDAGWPPLSSRGQQSGSSRPTASAQSRLRLA